MPTPYMSLSLPVVGVTLGPAWATALNVDVIEKIDAHDHSLNNGAELSLSNILIDADISWNSQSINDLFSIEFDDLNVTNQPTTKGHLYMRGEELYFRNGTTNVRITNGAQVDNAAAGSINGLPGALNGAVDYSEPGAAPEFEFNSDSGHAHLRSGNLYIYEQGALVAQNICIKSPAALAASYDITLPAALPASTNIVHMSNAGVLSLSTSIVITALQLVAGAGAGKVFMSDAGGNASWQDLIPVGTKMVFYQATAPSGWTADAISDRFLRVVNSGGTGGSVGGTHNASTNIGNHTHAGPSHTHSNSDTGGVSNSGGDNTASMGIRDSGGVVRDPAYFGYATGASTQGQHGHFMSSTGAAGTGSTGISSLGSGSFKYADIIICTKN